MIYDMLPFYNDYIIMMLNKNDCITSHIINKKYLNSSIIIITTRKSIATMVLIMNHNEFKIYTYLSFVKSLQNHFNYCLIIITHKLINIIR